MEGIQKLYKKDNIAVVTQKFPFLIRLGSKETKKLLKKAKTILTPSHCS